MFEFFLILNRSGIIDFCGSDTIVVFDVNGVSCKECFRLHEDGFYKNKTITTKHPNILRSVMIGKKGWGLWLDEWTSGIVECSFTKEEIFETFVNNNIIIPESFIIEFDKLLLRKKIKRNDSYLSQKGII